ncbi:MAG: fatty acid desaturase [Acidimicrobiia bacterium]|nr:fatty acid desaturase [Acidimicrobiia bacterium]
MTTITEPGSLAPSPDELPDVLPTDRLFSSGKPKPGILPDLRTIDDRRNAISVIAVYIQLFGSWALAGYLDHPLMWAAMFIWSTRCIAMLGILNHEAAHALLFSNRRLNDVIARYFMAPLVFSDFDAYRFGHLAHHKEELGPDEPDMSLYAPYPSGNRIWRRLARDLFGVSASKLLRAISGSTRPIRRRVLIAQLTLFPMAWLLTGSWWGWFAVWFLPWASVHQVNNRLRAIAEHAGMKAGKDRRVTTHVVRQNRAAQFMLAPFKTGYHLAHHVDTSVPWRELDVLHQELEQAGWITSEMTHPNYRSLWHYLATGVRN